MRVALDGHGSDTHPAPEIAGAVAAVQAGTPVVLVGDQAKLEPEAKRVAGGRLPDGLSFVHAPDVIAMDDEPSRAVRRKKDASMVRAFDLVKAREADAVVTCGNSGAAMVLGTLVLGRIAGVERPAIAQHIPHKTGMNVMLDAGATVDCKPEWLLQFGHIGAAYARSVLQIADPRVGLLANGTEDGKGNAAVQAAHALFKEGTPFHYVGLVEPMDFFRGDIDVAVMDGFAGNLMLKTIEGVAESIFGFLKREIAARPLATAGAMLAKPAFAAVKARADFEAHGAAPLLGVDGAVFIGHGRSSHRAVTNAIFAARKYVERGAIPQIAKAFESAHARIT